MYNSSHYCHKPCLTGKYQMALVCLGIPYPEACQGDFMWPRTCVERQTLINTKLFVPLIAKFREPTWGPSGADRTQVDPMLAQWTLLSGAIITVWHLFTNTKLCRWDPVTNCLITHNTIFVCVPFVLWRTTVAMNPDEFYCLMMTKFATKFIFLYFVAKLFSCIIIKPETNVNSARMPQNDNIRKSYGIHTKGHDLHFRPLTGKADLTNSVLSD